MTLAGVYAKLKTILLRSLSGFKVSNDDPNNLTMNLNQHRLRSCSVPLKVIIFISIYYF